MKRSAAFVAGIIMARVDDGRTSVTGLDVGPAFLLQFDDDDQVYRVTVTVEPEGTEP